jgi:O-methyltransferase
VKLFSKFRLFIIHSIQSFLNKLLLIDVLVSRSINKPKYNSGGVLSPHYLNCSEEMALAINLATQRIGRNPYQLWKVVIYLSFVESSSHILGDYVELGVGKGFMTCAALNYSGTHPQRQFFLFDKFDPSVVNDRTGEILNGLTNQDYGSSLSEVESNLSEFATNCTFIPGLLPESIELDSLSSISFLHIDLNAAEPEVASLRLLWNLITPGGIVILDDYCHAGRKAQFKAINELGLELKFNVLSLPTGQGVIIKR